MKKLSLAFLTLLVVSSCVNKEQKVAKENVTLIENYIKSVENLDFNAMGDLLDDSYLGIGPSVNDSINKPEAIESWKYNVENLYESIKYTKSRTFAVYVPDGQGKGNWVANWAETHVVYKEGQGDVTVLTNTIYKIENSKIVESYTFYNEADVLEQLGYVFINVNNLY
jgi:hypothetical protein